MAYPYKLYIWLGNLEEDNGILLGELERLGNTANKITVYNEINTYGNTTIKPCLNYEFVKARFRINQTIYKSSEHTIKNEWSLQATGTTEIDIVFYDKKHKVTLDLNYDGAGIQETLTVSCGVKLPDIDVPERQGYTFDSYRLSPSYSTIKYYDENGHSDYIWASSTMDQHDATSFTLYAYWNKSTYRLTFNKDGGTGGSNYVDVTIGELVPQITIPQKTGYKFLGYWVDGTSIQYYDKNGKGLIVWNATNNGTLTARWEAITYDIPIYYGGGTYYDSITATYNNTIPDITPPTATGYDFLGTYDIGGNRYHNSSGICSIKWDGDYSLKLYLRFEGKYKLTITYDAVGGKFSDNTTKFTETYNGPEQYVSFTITNEEPKKSGATFNYWAGLNTDGTIYTDGDGNKKYYYSGKTYELNSSYTHTLSAIWTYTMKLEDYDDKTVYHTMEVTYGNTLPYSVPIPTKEGYEFLGYYTEGYYTASGGVKYYDANGIRQIDSDWLQNYGGSLYAVWKEAKYKLTLNFSLDIAREIEALPPILAWGNTSPVMVTIPDEIPERENCEFICWAAINPNTGEFYNDDRFSSGEIIPLTASESGYSHTLTAVWRYTIGLDPNDGNQYSLSQIPYTHAVYGGYPEDLDSVPTKEGFSFKGYYNQPDGTIQYYNRSGVGITKWYADYTEARFYAQWGPPLFKWTYEKIAGEKFRVHQDEWNELQDFINSKRSTQFKFTRAIEGMRFTAAMYNEILAALGVNEEFYVKQWQPVTAQLMNDIVDKANAM